MMRIVSEYLRVVVIVGLSLYLAALPADVWAQRRHGGGARPRPNVSRAGPARSGSFHHTRPDREREGARRVDRRAPERATREDFSDRREAMPERIDAARDHHDGDRPNGAPDRVDDRREARRDYYDDRRDRYEDQRRFVRGARYSATWWTTNSCSGAVVVVEDGYSYYRCDDVWFGRTYYGGEVTYTVIDPPSGY